MIFSLKKDYHDKQNSPIEAIGKVVSLKRLHTSTSSENSQKEDSMARVYILGSLAPQVRIRISYIMGSHEHV